MIGHNDVLPDRIRLILTMLDCDRPRTIVSIARELGEHTSLVTRVMTSCERQEFVERSQGQNRRVRLWSLTEAGKQRLDALQYG